MVDVVVAGGGIIGILTALECRQRGAEVTVVDAGRARPSASWAGGGILSPLFPWRYPDAWLPLTRDAGQRYQQWGKEIVAAGLAEPELNACGMLVRAADHAEALAWGARTGVRVQWASESDLGDALTRQGDCWMPDVAAVRNPRWLAGLQMLAARRGVRFVADRVTAVEPGRVSLSEGDALTSDAVVVSAGHWSSDLLPASALRESLQPVKGEMLLFQCEPGEVPAILLAEEGYLIPRSDGLVLAGSTVEPGVRDQRPTAAAATQLQDMAVRWQPSLAGRTPVAQWSGLRPGSARRVPYIGPLPGSRGVWLAAGHFRNGLVSAPATAQLLAQQVAGEETFCDPAPYSPSGCDSSSDSF